MAIIPCNPLKNDPCTLCHLLELIINIYNILLGLAALVFLLMIIWNGILMLYHGMDENPEQILTGAKVGLRRAVAGFALIMIAFLLVSTLLVVFGAKPISDILNPLSSTCSTSTVAPAP